MNTLESELLRVLGESPPPPVYPVTARVIGRGSDTVSSDLLAGLLALVGDRPDLRLESAHHSPTSGVTWVTYLATSETAIQDFRASCRIIGESMLDELPKLARHLSVAEKVRWGFVVEASPALGLYEAKRRWAEAG